MRVDAGSVPVKDRYRDNADEKSINSCQGEHDKNAASVGALLRIEKEKRNMSGNADGLELRRRIGRCIRHCAVTIEAFARGFGDPVAQYTAQISAIRLALLA